MSPDPVRFVSTGMAQLRTDIDEISLAVHALHDAYETARAQIALLAAEVTILTEWQRAPFWQRLRWLLFGV
jgi:hypothetical protein